MAKVTVLGRDGELDVYSNRGKAIKQVTNDIIQIRKTLKFVSGSKIDPEDNDINEQYNIPAKFNGGTYEEIEAFLNKEEFTFLFTSMTRSVSEWKIETHEVK